MKAWEMTDDERHQWAKTVLSRQTKLIEILKDGEGIAIVDDDKVMAWFHSRHCYSMQHALDHEGYSLHPLERELK